MEKLRFIGRKALSSALINTFGISKKEVNTVINNFKSTFFDRAKNNNATQDELTQVIKNWTDVIKAQDFETINPYVKKYRLFKGTSLEEKFKLPEEESISTKAKSNFDNFAPSKAEQQEIAERKRIEAQEAAAKKEIEDRIAKENPGGFALSKEEQQEATIKQKYSNQKEQAAKEGRIKAKQEYDNLSPEEQERMARIAGTTVHGNNSSIKEAKQDFKLKTDQEVEIEKAKQKEQTERLTRTKEDWQKIDENEANAKKHVAESKEVRDEARRHQNDLYHKLINEKSINTDDATIKSIKRHQAKHQPSSSKPTDKEIYNNFQTASNELEQAKTEMAKLQQEGAEDHIIEGARSRLENAQKKYTVSQSKWGNTQTYRNQKAQRLAEERAEREGITIAEASEKNAIDKQAQKEAKKRAKYQENIDWNDVYDNMGFGGVKGKGQKVSSNQQSKTNTSSENSGKEPKNNNTQSGQKSNNNQSGGGLSFSGSAKAHMMKRLKKEMKNVDVNNIDQVSAFLGKQVSEEELKNSKNIKKMMRHKVAQKMKNEGPGVWDYVAGNPNTSAAVGGSLVLTGLAATTMNNGRKSNSQLYSSPI